MERQLSNNPILVYKRETFQEFGKGSKELLAQTTCFSLQLAGTFFKLLGGKQPRGLPRGTSDKEPACQCRRLKRKRFDPWLRKISWRRQPTPIFLSGESQWTEEPGGVQSMGSQRVGHN